MGVNLVPVSYTHLDVYKRQGLNHMCFGYNIHIGQKPLSEEQFKKVAEYRGPEDAKLCVELGCLPSPYLQYYYHTSKRVKELQEKELSRAQEVLLVEKEVYADYSNPECCTKPVSYTHLDVYKRQNQYRLCGMSFLFGHKLHSPLFRMSEQCMFRRKFSHD